MRFKSTFTKLRKITIRQEKIRRKNLKKNEPTQTENFVTRRGWSLNMTEDID